MLYNETANRVDLDAIERLCELFECTSLPNGLNDLLLDERIRELALRLRDSGDADVERLTGDARRRRLTEVLARLLPDLLEEAADAEDDCVREQRELALINGLLTHLRQGDARACEWTAPVLALRAIYRDRRRSCSRCTARARIRAASLRDGPAPTFKVDLHNQPLTMTTIPFKPLEDFAHFSAHYPNKISAAPFRLPLRQAICAR